MVVVVEAVIFVGAAVETRMVEVVLHEAWSLHIIFA